MRRLLLAAVTAAMLIGPAQAQAVSYEYCAYSLRGGGNLAPDNDVRREWDRLEAANGVNIVSSYVEYWSGSSGSWTVHPLWVFVRANGSAYRVWFSCWGSSSTYGDG